MFVFLIVYISLVWHGTRHVSAALQRPGRAIADNTVEDDVSDFKDIAGIRSFIPEKGIQMRIIGGKEAWAHSWPWQVSLHYVKLPSCGGAILSTRWVVTATHCFLRYNKASFWSVLAGKHDLDNPHEDCQQELKVSKIFTHKGYDRRTKRNDVALVKLQTPLTYSDCVKPIRIFTRPLEPFNTCTITGWGVTRENGARAHLLQEANITVLPSKLCNQFYRGKVQRTMFCAGKEDGGVDACQGDSGGPLTYYTKGRYKLVGVVSWGVGCGRARRPGVYTMLKDYVSWINTIQEDHESMMDDDPGFLPEEICGEAERAPRLTDSVPAEVTAPREGEVRATNVTEASPNSWPWQVSLQSGGQHSCSGTLVHPRWVLAPRHCRDSGSIDTVVLGCHDLRFLASQTLPVESVFDFPQDGGFPPASDLSLFRLAKDARTGATVAPVCLPHDDLELDDSWSCVTTGWGTSSATPEVSGDALHQARLRLVNGSACGECWGKGLIRETHLCTDPAGSVSCLGDHGSPLLCQKRSVYYLFGLVTWGSPNCDVHKPAVFTKLSAYDSWISNITDA